MADGTHFDWAQRLGLTANYLFGHEAPRSPHFALLDGVSASFLLSEHDSLGSPKNVVDCTWSANLRTHVLARSDRIEVTRVGGRSPEAFSRASVETRLSEFLEFLEKSSTRDSVSSVEHVLSLFRRHKDTVGPGRERDWYVSSFLYLLGLSQRPGATPDAVAEAFHIDVDAFDPDDLPDGYAHRFLFELEHFADRTLLPALTVRHAGGHLFQEAHAEALASPGQLTLWGLSGGAGPRRLDLSQGVYYTPPGLARTLSDLAIRPHLHRPEVVIRDPACGSGLFLSEAIRALQRADYRGRVSVSGIDVSPTAARLARFCLASARLDWPEGDVTWEVSVGDYLEATPDRAADVTLMNPPFVAWEAMPAPMKEEVQLALGDSFAGRPDLSMAFITKALREAAPLGTMATLLPRGILDSKYGQRWRSSLLEEAELQLVAVLGEHNLFRHAVVSVGAALFRKTTEPSDEPIVKLWADQRPQSADRALRALRQTWPTLAVVDDPELSFKILPTPGSDLRSGGDWLPRPNAVGPLLDFLRESCPTTVGDLFEIEQGIKTGLNEAFIYTAEDLRSLRADERAYFKRIAGGSDIRYGEIQSNRYLFYAVDAFSSEEEFYAGAPETARRMAPFKPRLQARRRMDPNKWWEPIWPRKKLVRSGPRILSKMFGSIDFAAADLRGDYLPLQAYAWVPSWREIDIPDDKAMREAVLRVYTKVLNSRVFYLLRREFSANVAGGQLDISPKNTERVPLPRLNREVIETELLGGADRALVASDQNDALTAKLYGTLLDAWPLRATYA
jgi:adenine-specific DNA-methyltransferase